MFAMVREIKATQEEQGRALSTILAARHNYNLGRRQVATTIGMLEGEEHEDDMSLQASIGDGILAVFRLPHSPNRVILLYLRI